MGREFELKYGANPGDIEFFRSKYPDLEPISMETTYYDSLDGKLGLLRWTLRRRMENGRAVCTLKTPAGDLGRNEWEVECGDIRDAIEPLLLQGAPRQLLLLCAAGLKESCGARFTRLAGKMEVEGATVELALDQGVLLGGGRELPFAEVEIELKEGSEEAVLRFAGKIAAMRNLKPEPRSKVARARALAKENL